MKECDVVLVQDPRQKCKTNPDGYFLARVDYPASWTPHEDMALRLTSLEVDTLQETWPYLEDCRRVPTDKILFVGRKG